MSHGPHGAPFKTITDPELIRKKNALRKAVSEEYIKQISNPYRNIKMEGGTLFDVGIQRYMSMKATQHEFFRATPKTSVLGILLMVIPFFSLTYYIKNERDRRESLIRTGQVAYRDRGFKLG